MSGGQVKQSEISLGPLRRSDLNSKLSCRAINHPSANPLEATVQIDMNCKYLSATIHTCIHISDLCDTFVNPPLHKGLALRWSGRTVGQWTACYIYLSAVCKYREESFCSWDAPGNHFGERHTFISVATTAYTHAAIPFSSSDLPAFSISFRKRIEEDLSF